LILPVKYRNKAVYYFYVKPSFKKVHNNLAFLVCKRTWFGAHTLFSCSFPRHASCPSILHTQPLPGQSTAGPMWIAVIHRGLHGHPHRHPEKHQVP